MYWETILLDLGWLYYKLATFCKDLYQNKAYCENTIGSFLCHCKNGYYAGKYKKYPHKIHNFMHDNREVFEWRRSPPHEPEVVDPFLFNDSLELFTWNILRQKIIALRTPGSSQKWDKQLFCSALFPEKPLIKDFTESINMFFKTNFRCIAEYSYKYTSGLILTVFRIQWKKLELSFCIIF